MLKQHIFMICIQYSRQMKLSCYYCRLVWHTSDVFVWYSRKIYTNIFVFSEKSCQCRDFRIRRVSNESSGSFTFYRGIHEFLNSCISEKITVFQKLMLYIVSISRNFLWSGNYSLEFKNPLFFQKDMNLKICEWKITRPFIWDRSPLSNHNIDNTFPEKRKYWCIDFTDCTYLHESWIASY